METTISKIETETNDSQRKIKELENKVTDVDRKLNEITAGIPKIIEEIISSGTLAFISPNTFEIDESVDEPTNATSTPVSTNLLQKTPECTRKRTVEDGGKKNNKKILLRYSWKKSNPAGLEFLESRADVPDFSRAQDFKMNVYKEGIKRGLWLEANNIFMRVEWKMESNLNGLLIQTGLENADSVYELCLGSKFSPSEILKRDSNLTLRDCQVTGLSLANKCKGLPEQDITRNTFKKNKIIDIRTWHVLPDDREFVLNLLCQTENSLPRDENFEFIIIAHRFGDRNSNAMNITEYDTANASTTIHAAVTLSSPILNQNLFWSRSGIQDIIGDRGTLYSSLSFRSCCNFQTNLDGRSIDISGDLRQLCTCPETLRFLQMYADLPHMSSSSIHPVFGCIASCGVLHGNIQKLLKTEHLNI
ncbi:unnamed protein product [Mytilus edulis]|uniref:Uncharacterized protein n=1 Tax=Mytilus edulis TaxID=6550 RepID=A0A8S3UCW2_MYTED|nr:unnamed protein product [Mytilus edulis]